MQTLQDQQANARIQEVEDRVEKLEKNFAYMQKDMGTLMGVFRSVQAFLTRLATDHREVQNRVRSWPFIKVNPKE